MSALLQNSKRATFRGIAAQLEARRDALDDQIAAMRAAAARNEAPEFSRDMLLALYLVAPGAKDVTLLCQAFGWKLPGVKGPRQVATKDIFDLIRGPVDGLTPELLSLALEKLEGRHDAQWGGDGTAWGPDYS